MFNPRIGRSLESRNPATRLGVLFVLCLASAPLVACGPPPKPTELSQLEGMLNDEFTAQLTVGAPAMLDKADKFKKMALKSWQEGDLARTKEYAWLGQLRYRTAEALTRTKEEAKRFEGAMEDLRKWLQEGEVVKAQIEGVNKSIVALEGTVNAYATQADTKQKTEAESVVLSVEAEREKARAVNALEYAAGPFNKAEGALKLAKEQLAAGRFAEAIKEANEANAGFAEAYGLAKPQVDQLAVGQQKIEREKALYDAAQKAFSPNALKDGRGVVVVLPRLFDKGKTAPLASQIFFVDQAVEIAKNFPETTVMIEGYTQNKGSDSKNLSLSQSRANIVRDHLLRNGVDAKRMTTTGYGEEKPRYDNSDSDARGKNDRVEIIFVM